MKLILLAALILSTITGASCWAFGKPNCTPDLAMRKEEERQTKTRDPETRGRKNCSPVSFEDFQSKLWNRHYFKIHVVCEFNPYRLEDKDFDVYYDAEFCSKSLGL